MTSLSNCNLEETKTGQGKLNDESLKVCYMIDSTLLDIRNRNER